MAILFQLESNHSAFLIEPVDCRYEHEHICFYYQARLLGNIARDSEKPLYYIQTCRSCVGAIEVIESGRPHPMKVFIQETGFIHATGIALQTLETSFFPRLSYLTYKSLCSILLNMLGVILVQQAICRICGGNL